MKGISELRHRPLGVFLFALIIGFFFAAMQPNMAQAGVGDVLLGAASSNDSIDPATINSSNFTDYFTYSGVSTSSLTMGGNNQAQIGAIWTGGSAGEWCQIRVVIDSNGDGTLQPFDWSDPSHPWNRPDNGTPDDPTDDPTSWTYTYPDDYPDDSLKNTTITMTWDESCMCVQDFPWDTFQQWWYESDYDRTDSWWMEKGQLMNIWWSGQDQEGHALPNGDYKVQVWVDEDNDSQFEATEANKTMLITVETAGITGTVKDQDGNAIEGADVDAGSYMAWGQSRTNADGTFTVSGLEAGAQYHVRVQASGKVTFETDVDLPDGATTASAGTITMRNAISITGTLKLDRNANGTTDETEDQFVAFTNQWGWEQNDMRVNIDVHNTQGPGWGNAEATFQVGDSSADFTVNIPPPTGTATYQLNVHAEGYATSPANVSVDSSGGDAGNITLTKASILTGLVQLPSAVSDWTNIDVQAIDTTDSDNRYWGCGNVDPNDQNIPVDQRGKQGNFRIDGIPAGTFTLEVRVMGYVMASKDITVTQGTDLDVGTINVSEGSKITGSFTIRGDTSTLQRWEGDSADPMDVWVDAWSPSGGWGGTNVQVQRGTDVSTTYSIGGLSSGTYEIHCWIGEGYELVDEDGNAPVMVTLASNATKNIVLKPYEGIVTGTITGDGVSVDLSKVVVEVKRPWDWLPPKFATVANGGIDAASGEYSVSGLGTGDYVVKAGMYSAFVDDQGNQNTDLSGYNGQGVLLADTTVGVEMQRAFVQNDADNPTTLNISFEQGYTISGTISLSSEDPPWHDFGDGTFDLQGQPAGDPNGKKDINANPAQSETISMASDVAGQSVTAMPMDMMFMGGQDPRMGVIQADGSYRIDGLAPGAYLVMTPFNSRRISAFETTSNNACFDGGQQTHHWTTTTQMVAISDGNVVGKDFELANGYTVTGSITLPEAQTATEDWEKNQWVGQLELETASHQFMGHGKPLFKIDFANSNRYDFTFHHVANGDYMVRFWTDRYVPGGAKLTVNNANASVNLTIEEGANLVGKLVDEDTGEAITSSDGVSVTCEAYPHVEGSWRETRDDEWSQSYIENDSGLKSGDMGGQEGQRENKTPGKFHLTAVPTGYKYVIVVETTCNGNKTGGAKNYVGQVIAGIDVPEGASGDVDVGTIKLKEGTTIKGRLTDADGNPIPGVDVCAMPSNSHDGSAEAQGTSDTQGYYTIYGINPDVKYYDLIAAERPFMFDDWGKEVEWGEKRKYNVAPETTDADFTLAPTSATLSGTITIPDAAEFMMPFKGEGEEFPAAYVLMQRKGVIYKDMLDGIEGSTMPMPSTATDANYTIDNVEPGTYKIIFMNYGLPTKVFDNVVISEGSNTQDVTWTTAGYTVSGSCALSTGGYPSSSDISGAVCMNVSNQTIIFGTLTQEADGSYSAYEVPGLADGQTYQLVFYKESGMDDMPDIFPVGDTFTVDGADITDRTATVSRNTEPIIMVQAIQDSDDADKIDLGIFSTTYLVDSSVSVVDTEPTTDSTAGELYIKTGDGSLSTPILSGDKRNITASYTKATDDSTVELMLAVHYGDDATTKLETISFNVNTVATNGDVVNVYTAGQVKMGNGDATQIYIPAGALETSDSGKALVTIEKSSEEPGSLALSRASIRTARSLGTFARAALTALPSGVTTAGNQYDFSTNAANDGASVEQKTAVTVQLQYDPDLVSDVDLLNVWHLVDGDETWTKETTNRTVDTENHTISVEVTSLSPFVPAVGDDSSSGSTVSLPGSSSGGCFIGTADNGLGLHFSQVEHIMIGLFIMISLFALIFIRKPDQA